LEELWGLDLVEEKCLTWRGESKKDKSYTWFGEVRSHGGKELEAEI